MQNPHKILVTRDESDEDEVVIRHTENQRPCRLPMSRDDAVTLISLLQAAVTAPEYPKGSKDQNGEALWKWYGLR